MEFRQEYAEEEAAQVSKAAHLADFNFSWFRRRSQENREWPAIHNFSALKGA